jgi:membrane protease subunit (stomatin/prohibitin family)
MGIFDTITGETKRNFIIRPDANKADIVWKHPDHNIRMMTQLTLAADEVCLFLKNGNKEGLLGPGGGPFTLNTNNVPFIASLMDKFTGGNLFIAELYFVSQSEATVQFGGELGSLTDAPPPVGTSMMVEAKVFGTVNVRVTNPEMLIKKIATTDPGNHAGNKFLRIFKEKILLHLSDAIGELSDKSASTLNKILSPSYKLELQESLIQQLKPVTDAAYGLEVVTFGNFKISIDEQAMKELNEKNMAIADDQRRMAMAQNPAYMAVAQAEMMRNAGKGMAKGGEGAGMAMGGMGMGMGMAMAQNFMGQGQQQHGQPAPQPVMVPQQQQAPQGIKCPACNNLTPPGKFCSSCGKPLVLASKCECGTELAPGGKFCANCGKSAATGPKKCECGTELSAGAKFCPNCGKAG